MENLQIFLNLDIKDIDEERQNELYKTLIESDVNSHPKKYLRKTLQLALASLKFKGKEVDFLKEQLEIKSAGDESGNDALIEEIERLKFLIGKLESEKSSLKIKLEDMNEEMTILQSRIHEISINESDRDSNDPLSELDKQEELLKKISTKNKHIKRLIRDIELLQMQNIEQSKIIIEKEQNAQTIASEKIELQSQLSVCEYEKNQLNEHIKELTLEITRLENNLTYLEEERERADFELKDFIEKLEERARAWRKLIDEKEKQLDSIKQKYELLRSENPKKLNNAEQEHELEKLVEAIQERDGVIEELEQKIKNMAEEMISSTKLMNQISAEREAEKIKDAKKNRICCKTTQNSLNLLQERYKELSEMMEKVEEDNILKSKQTASVLKSLGDLQNGDDVIGNSLRKISHLERKLESRDKQIKALIMEINSLHELSQENSVLRKRLHISEDEIILTSNLAAKQRNKEKVMERLTLKFRASEEMRLQLKLEKTELKKEILDLKKKLNDVKNSNNLHVDEGFVENKKDTNEIRKEIYCDNCLKNIQSIPNQENIMNDVIKEWENKYSEVIEENENLRVGMHEILEKIRDYDASSDHITIDCSILERVLHALDARSISGWYHPAMRIQNELIAVKEREYALKEKIQYVEKAVKTVVGGKIEEKIKLSDKEQSSIEHAPSETREIIAELPSNTKEELLEMNIDEEELGEISCLNNQIEKTIESEKSTESIKKQPTDFLTMVVERSFEQETYKKELGKLIDKNRNLQLEIEALRTYKIQFLEMLEEMKKSEKEIVGYCSSIVERSTDSELKLKNCIKKYEFLKEDFDKTLTDFKFSENINISLISDLKKQINNKKHEINLIKLVENKRKLSHVPKDEILVLKKKYTEISNQLAILMSTFFKDNEGRSLIGGISINMGIIKDDMQLDFITWEEFENLKNYNKILQEDNNNLKLNCKQLEENIIINQEQIKSQQKLISEITDNHIDLRHLVADLQSSSEEKFLVTKAYRDLEILKKENNRLRQEKENLEKQVEDEKGKSENLTEQMKESQEKFEKQSYNNDLKIEFLKKFVFEFQEKYCKYTPLIYLTNFAFDYAKLWNKYKDTTQNEDEYLSKINDIVKNKLKSVEKSNESSDIIKLIQCEVKCIFLEDQLKLIKTKLENTEGELHALQIKVIEDNQQCKTIQALFGKDRPFIETKNKMIQTIETECKDAECNTDKMEEIIIEKFVEKEVPIQIPPQKSDFQSQAPTPTIRRSLERQDTVIIQSSAQKQSSIEKNKINEEILLLENQLQQAKSLASKRSALLLDSENKLAEANGKLKEMEKIIENLKRTVKTENYNTEKKNSGIIEATITSLQSLLSEKDVTLKHYQELLKTEREQHLKSCETYEKEIKSLKQIQNEHENILQNKNTEISELTKRLEALNRKNSLRNGNNESGKILNNEEFDQNCDNSLNEISDEKIEEMFLDESKSLTLPSATHLFMNLPNLDECPVKQIHQLQSQIRESKSRELFWENSVRAKDEEIFLLKEKINILQEREKPEISSAEIDQLKVLLEEKDKHINDLMETLASFHDDQQTFLNETSLYSADQMTQLGANLNRCEATNKILQAQLDALKKQLATLSQREKQSRDLANSLRNQLLKRPVLSIKSDVNSKNKNEQQKRIQHLESELEACRKQILQQQHIIETKRAKNANEVNMWEKQKRHQQNAERLKLKLEETEKSLEKTRSLLNAARTTINRLEKDKNALQSATLKDVW
ncbi:centrosomal protein cep290 isoform X3 [Condylostylus longicornis]|uniref:centrosomal protein cep290 isoform X3 n=1 Tax=Condylostylus longicornis TaxID=2530218 RepID=UPI00244E1F0A|nr:centrosomal protein cep290 isoform X3 [Condylostylus longicornis]